MHLKKFFVVGFRGMGFCSFIKYRLYVVEPETNSLVPTVMKYTHFGL